MSSIAMSSCSVRYISAALLLQSVGWLALMYGQACTYHFTANQARAQALNPAWVNCLEWSKSAMQPFFDKSVKNSKLTLFA